MDLFYQSNFNWLDIFMRDKNERESSNGKNTEGANDIHFFNGIIVAEDFEKVNCFYAISEIKKIW